MTYDGLTDPLGQSQILPYLSGLSGKGFRIHIISFEKKGRFLKYRDDIEHLTANANIQWTPLTYHKRPPVLSTLFDILKLRRIVYKLVRKQKIDIIHCRSYITSLIGLSVKKEMKIPFIFDMRGFWADERVEGKLWNLKNPLYSLVFKYFKRKENLFLKHSDVIISLTENAKTEMESNLFSGSAIKTATIPCCVDLNLFNPENFNKMDKIEHRKKIGIREEEFVLMYLGSLGTWYMTDEMLSFYKKLLKEKPDSKFIFLTKDHEVLIRRLKHYNLSFDILAKNGLSEYSSKNYNVLITEASRNTIPMYLNLCDASIFFYNPTYSKKATSPTKMGEILAMNKPVITNSGYGDVDMLLSDSNYGVLVKSMDTEGYSRAIKDLDQLISLQKNNIRELAETYYSLEEGVNKYKQVYDKLTKP